MNYSEETLIDNEVFMYDDHEETNPVAVYLEKETDIFHTRDGKGNIRKFVLTRSFDDLNKDEATRLAILQYRGLTSKLETLMMIDVFMHGKYVEEITNE